MMEYTVACRKKGFSKWYVNPNLLMDIDKKLTGGSGVGDIRSGEERAAFTVDYVLDPNIPAKPPVADNAEDPIRDANGNYIFTKGENGKYQFVFTDSEGHEHSLETDEIPFTVTDGNGNTYEVILTESASVNIFTVNELGQNNSLNQPVDTVRATKKINDLAIELQKRIREKLSNSADGYAKMAYNNVDILPLITEFDPSLGAGGQYRNGKMYIGTRNFTENSSDEDILATIYHEYMHYLNWQYGDKYRMEDREKGIVYSIKVMCFENRMQTQDEFLDYAYFRFYTDKINTPDATIYLDYPVSYKKLNDIQKEEVDKYIEEKILIPEIECISYQYSPSNYCKDEINAHSETLDAHNTGLFKMSIEKVDLYNSEITRYGNLYDKSKLHEMNNNINSNGYEN